MITGLTVPIKKIFFKTSNCLLFKVEKNTAFKCGTFGASSLRQRHLATGDFEGRLQIW